MSRFEAISLLRRELTDGISPELTEFHSLLIQSVVFLPALRKGGEISMIYFSFLAANCATIAR